MSQVDEVNSSIPKFHLSRRVELDSARKLPTKITVLVQIRISKGYILSFWFKSRDRIVLCTKVSFQQLIPPMLFLSETRVELQWLASFAPRNIYLHFRSLIRDALRRAASFPILSFLLSLAFEIEGNLRRVVPILLKKCSSLIQVAVISLHF
ncbi:Uncharacterized protein Fot_22801 [Forsythia ovata]|uniref:Uncharacterized protein n=1 Tax=Forsythia ovata TaxID=205694 RepID=A0ABD1UYS5_9LAMI